MGETAGLAVAVTLGTPRPSSVLCHRPTLDTHPFYKLLGDIESKTIREENCLHLDLPRHLLIPALLDLAEDFL